MLLCLDVIVVYAVVVIVFVIEFLMMEVEFGRWGGGGRVQWGHLCKTNHTKIIQFW